MRHKNKKDNEALVDAVTSAMTSDCNRSFLFRRLGDSNSGPSECCAESYPATVGTTGQRLVLPKTTRGDELQGHHVFFLKVSAFHKIMDQDSNQKLNTLPCCLGRSPTNFEKRFKKI